jgi:hypothetical protein
MDMVMDINLDMETDIDTTMDMDTDTPMDTDMDTDMDVDRDRYKGTVGVGTQYTVHIRITIPSLSHHHANLEISFRSQFRHFVPI